MKNQKETITKTGEESKSQIKPSGISEIKFKRINLLYDYICDLARLSNTKIIVPIAIKDSLPFLTLNLTTNEQNALVSTTKPISVNNLSKLLGMQQANTSRLVNKLEKKDLVKKVKDSKDKRITWIVCTEKAKPIISEEKSILIDNLTKNIENHLSADEFDKLIEAYKFICAIYGRFN